LTASPELQVGNISQKLVSTEFFRIVFFAKLKDGEIVAHDIQIGLQAMPSRAGASRLLSL
jgi:hypothetical protein